MGATRRRVDVGVALTAPGELEMATDADLVATQGRASLRALR